MLSTKEAQDLLELSFLIHTQILEEHGNVLNHPHEVALRALHSQLAGMVDGEASEWQGRWGLAAPVGFGKSSGIAAFIAAAYQKKFLGNGVTLTFTASRVGQLYDFEKAIINAGIPPSEIRKYVSVLHHSDKHTVGVIRESDVNRDVPVLLVTHNRINRTYRPNGDRKILDLTYFLKYRDEPRDLVVWDERCTISEAISLTIDSLNQAVMALKVSAIGQKAESLPAVRWIEGLTERLKHEAHTATLEGQERILESLATLEQREWFQSFLKRTPGYNHALRTNLYILLDLLKFPLRVLPTGIISYRVVVPDCMSNVLVLDASFDVSALSRIDTTIQDLEDAQPLLLDIQRRYKKRLKDIKDYSDLTFVHWNKGAGKEEVEKATDAYLSGSAEDGNVMHEVIQWLKPRVTAGKAILICTNKLGSSNVDLGERVRACLKKAGFDLSKTVIDPHSHTRDQDGTLQPVYRSQITVETYGRLDASNEYSYCSVTVNLGVQQRNELDLSAAICGQKRDITATLTKQQIKEVLVTERAVVVQQSHGRGQSRVVRDGKALPQEALLVYYDTKDQNLTSLLKPLYPGATWYDFKGKTVKADGTPTKIIATWVDQVKVVLSGLPVETVSISSRKLKVLAGAQSIAARTWAKITQTISGEATFPWTLRGQSFVHHGRLFNHAA